jgi:hypothetical protein
MESEIFVAGTCERHDARGSESDEEGEVFEGFGVQDVELF